MNLFDHVTQNQRFFVIFILTKTTSLDQFIMPNLIKVSFISVHYTLMTNMALKLVYLYKENMPEGEGATLNLGLHFFVNISKFGVLYLPEFGRDSYKTYTQ